MKGEKVQDCSSFEYIYKNGKLGQVHFPFFGTISCWPLWFTESTSQFMSVFSVSSVFSISLGRQCWCLFQSVRGHRSIEDRLHEVCKISYTYSTVLNGLTFWFKIVYLFHLCSHRTGKRTRWGLLQDGYNSMIRYYKNNFSDGFRQVRVKLVSGGLLSNKSVYGFSPPWTSS